jgi:hypothetical protein
LWASQGLTPPVFIIICKFKFHFVKFQKMPMKKKEVCVLSGGTPAHILFCLFLMALTASSTSTQV